MRRGLLGGALLAVVAGFHALSFVTGAAGLSRILAHVGAPAWAPWAGSLFLEIAKATLLAASAVMLMTPTIRHRALGLVCGAIWLAAVLLSVAATKGTVSDLFAARERAASLSTERRAFLQSAMSDAQAQLARVQASRPVDVVRAEIERLKLNPRWTSSEGCTAVTTPESRTLCDSYQKAFAEMASATSAAQMRAQIAELRRELGQTPAAASTDPMIGAFDLMLGRWLGMPGHDGVALLVVVAAELGSMFGLAMVVLVMVGPELQRQHGAIDRIADSQVEALRSAAGRLREVAPPDSSEAQRQAHLEGPTPSRPRSPTNLSKATPAGGMEGLTKVDQEPSTVRLEPVNDASAGPSAACATEVSRHAAGRTLQVVGSHTPDFVADCFDRDPDSIIQASAIWVAYERWCRVRKIEPVSQTKLGRELVGLGLEKEKQGVVRYAGLRLKPMAEVA